MATSTEFSDASSGDRGDYETVNSPDTQQVTPRSGDDLTHNQDSDRRSLSDKSYISVGSHSLYSDPNSDSDCGKGKKTSYCPREKSAEQTLAKGKRKTKRVFHAMSTFGNKGTLGRKPWKLSSSKAQHLHGKKNGVEGRILSAQVHKIQQLANELHNVQRMLEAANSENKSLTNVQKRHLKALEKYQSSENSVDQLIARHDSEVRALTESLKAMKENERSLTKKLKASESELLKTKDQLQKLQKLTEDKNLAERHELNDKLSALMSKLEMGDSKIKALDKQLYLMMSYYERQLDLQCKKLSEARDTTKKLQAEILALQNKIKEKDKELSIRNIYVHRMLRDKTKYESLTYQRGLTSTKATQTVADMVLQDQPNKQVGQQTDPPEKDNDRDHEKERGEENNSQITSEETPIQEAQQEGENDNFLETDARKKEQHCGNERFGEELDTVFNKSNLVPQDTTQVENILQDELSNTNKAGAGSLDTNQAKLFIPRLQGNYRFTEATENLHQGLPATGQLSRFSSSRRNLMIKGESSVGYKPSSPKIEAKAGSNDNKEEKMEKGNEVLPKDRKKKLIEELFGPRYNLR